MTKAIKWVPVESSAIAAIAYDRKTKVLYVEFNHGGQYQYEGIGYHRWRQLRDADSKGKYYNQAIKVRKQAA